MDTAGHDVAFVFPAVPGHLNPSLGLARALVDRGCRVHFMCPSEALRGMIEATGAIFYSAVQWQPELYVGRELKPVIGAVGAIREEHGLVVKGSHNGAVFMTLCKICNIMMELQLPGTLRLLRRVRPSVVVYDPMLGGGCRDAFYAAKLLGIPSVALLSVAGPGGYASHVMDGGSAGGVEASVGAFAPHLAATARLNAEYGLGLPALPGPLGMLDVGDNLVLVTTSQALADPLTAEHAAAYRERGTGFAFVGPLLDRQGSLRAGSPAASECQALQELWAAREAGRPVVLVSMGTLLTNDVPQGWEGRAVGADGLPRGLNGRELCRAVWGGAFAGLGAAGRQEGALLLVALGARPDALGDLVPPPNALVVQALPQVDILRAGIDVFLTHGGQNSFTEALVTGTPLVVCPGFGDQTVNSRKAVALGVGLKVDRPDPDAGQVLAEPGYREASMKLAADLREAGGVPRAAELVLAAASTSACSRHGSC